jgi:hypothetical protein
MVEEMLGGVIDGANIDNDITSGQKITLACAA